jgi:hypothetical protein
MCKGRERVRGLLIGKYFTLQLGIFSDSQLDTLDGQIYRAQTLA